MFLFIYAQTSHIFTRSTLENSQNFDLTRSKTSCFSLLGQANDLSAKMNTCSSAEFFKMPGCVHEISHFNDEFLLRFWTTKINVGPRVLFWISDSGFPPCKSKREVSSFQILPEMSNHKFAKLTFLCTFGWQKNTACAKRMDVH